jgi:hypothetical protein
VARSPAAEYREGVPGGLVEDGGRRLWGLFDELFSHYATGILDFYHAVQNLGKGAAAWLDGLQLRPAGGSHGRGTACGTVCLTGS